MGLVGDWMEGNITTKTKKQLLEREKERNGIENKDKRTVMMMWRKWYSELNAPRKSFRDFGESCCREGQQKSHRAESMCWE